MAHALLAGACRKEITPFAAHYPLPQREGKAFVRSLESIYVRALALQSSRQTLLLISFELFGTPFATTLRNQLALTLGLAAECVLICDTYNHCAPREDLYRFDISSCQPGAQERTDAYFAFCMEAGQSAAANALAQLRPARVGLANSASHINVNRDQLFDYGWSLGQNFSGPSDKELGILCVERLEDRMPIAYGVNYALYGNMCYMASREGDTDLAVNSDLPGALCAALEKIHPSACAFWLSGAAGDQDPLVLAGYTAHLAPGVCLPAQFDEPGIMQARDCLCQRMLGDLLPALRRTHWFPLAGLAAKRTVLSLPGKDTAPGRAISLELQLLRIGPLRIAAISGAPVCAIGRLLLEALPGSMNLLVTHAGSFTGYITDMTGFLRETFQYRSMLAQAGAFEVAALPELQRLEALCALELPDESTQIKTESV